VTPDGDAGPRVGEAGERTVVHVARAV
jgi:hypothetical protein